METWGKGEETYLQLEECTNHATMDEYVSDMVPKLRYAATKDVPNMQGREECA